MPTGVYILGVLYTLLGAWLLTGSIGLLFSLYDDPSPFLSRLTIADAFAILGIVSQSVASALMVVSGLALLLRPRWKQLVALPTLAMAAAGAATVFGGLVALFAGRSFYGLAFMMAVVQLLTGLVLLIPTAIGVWYLRRSRIRLALEAGREPDQAGVELEAAADRPGG
jgi:hypothetical protein